MSRSLSDLQELRTVLGRLNAERRAGLSGWEGETYYESRAAGFHKRLNLEVTSRGGKARTLVTGQIGVGISCLRPRGTFLSGIAAGSRDSKPVGPDLVDCCMDSAPLKPIAPPV